MLTKNFPAEHKSFYAEFDTWRKSKMNESLPKSGVYRLISNKKIGRLLKTDDKGVLYIGKGVILSNSNRIGKFINAINDTEKRHGGGVRFNTDLIRENFPLENSTIEINLCENPEQMEVDLLNSYLDEFGELPPFNRKMESIY